MQDLKLADTAFRAADTDRDATQEELEQLNEQLGTTLAKSVTSTDESGQTQTMTKGELYRRGYEALWDDVGGHRRIEDLIDAYVVPQCEDEGEQLCCLQILRQSIVYGFKVLVFKFI